MRAKRAVAWCLFAVATLAAVVGSVFNLYEKVSWYDEAVHGYFTFSLTLVLALYAYGVVLTGTRDHGLLLVLTIASIGIALGVLWEVLEWGYDQMARPNAILGKTDTIVDLILDALGALAAGLTSLQMLKNLGKDRE